MEKTPVYISPNGALYYDHRYVLEIDSGRHLNFLTYDQVQAFRRYNGVWGTLYTPAGHLINEEHLLRNLDSYEQRT